MTQSTQTNRNEILQQTYCELRPQILTYLRSRLNDDSLAEDLLQDVFLRLLDSDCLLCTDTLRSLIFTMARNILFDHLRRQQKQRDIWNYLYETAPVYENLEHTVNAHELAEAELHIVSQLPERRRAVYELSRYEGLSTTEISLRLGMSQRTADTHLFLGRREVRQYLHACGF